MVANGDTPRKHARLGGLGNPPARCMCSNLPLTTFANWKNRRSLIGFRLPTKLLLPDALFDSDCLTLTRLCMRDFRFSLPTDFDHEHSAV